VNDVTRPRIVYIHGNRTLHWATAWTGWLRDELQAQGFRTFFETFPDSIDARRRYWMEFLTDHVAAGPDDVLLGWSSGAVAAMRYAETRRIRGSVLVCPYTGLDDRLERDSGFFDGPFDWDATRGNQGDIAVFHSDEDPFIPYKQFVAITEALDATTFEVFGGRHFLEQREFPQLLEYIRLTYG
jgi:predicted alpha/beta hydrolase family esterase